MRILWFCNVPISKNDLSGTGTWLNAMAHGLMESGNIELGVISEAKVSHIIKEDCNAIHQWLIPESYSVDKTGLPPSIVLKSINNICEEFAPDLIHVWGTEGNWGLLTARKILNYPVLLEIQGLKMTIVDVFYGGLSFWERLNCIGLKEILKRRIMKDERRDFYRWGIKEKEIILGHSFIEFQSPWVASQVRAINPNARLFKTERVLREEFAVEDSWKLHQQPIIFTSAAYPSSFKGLHVAIRAFRLLQKRIPRARLRIAGPHQRKGIRQEGYIKWLNSLIKEFGLADNIDWLGNLSAIQIVKELKSAKVVLIPSFVESYCVAMAEAMRIGTPVVASFIGGTSYLGKDEETCLFFPPGDFKMCAYQLERVISEDEVACLLSAHSFSVAIERHDSQKLISQQIDTYNIIFDCAGMNINNSKEVL